MSLWWARCSRPCGRKKTQQLLLPSWQRQLRGPDCLAGGCNSGRTLAAVAERNSAPDRWCMHAVGSLTGACAGRAFALPYVLGSHPGVPQAGAQGGGTRLDVVCAHLFEGTGGPVSTRAALLCAGQGPKRYEGTKVCIPRFKHIINRSDPVG
jgi:hypothetical protein